MAVRIKKLLKGFQKSIAFYPFVMGIAGYLFALVMLYLESRGISTYMTKHFPYFVLQNSDTGKTMMSLLAAGIISIMVYSFSQVMVLLNQVSLQYSPRVLPGIISRRSHQYVLGLYIGTIVYCIFILMGIEPDNNAYLPPGFSVIVGILLTIVCLFAFIYFISSMSKAIQIHSILDHIFRQAYNTLEELIAEEDSKSANFTTSLEEVWHPYFSHQLGYFVINSERDLFNFCLRRGMKLSILPIEGDFVHKNQLLYKCNRILTDQEAERIGDHISLVHGELVPENYVLAFKQITEVGIKAMSPSVNDPGTAINTIDYLTELLSLRMRKKDTHHFIKDEEVILSIQPVKFHQLLYQVMVAYRTYAKRDMSCNQKLMIMFNHLLHQNTHERIYLDAIWKAAKSHYADARKAIENIDDIEVLDGMFKELKELAETKGLVLEANKS